MLHVLAGTGKILFIVLRSSVQVFGSFFSLSDHDDFIS
jgi:hypothetical protein